MKTFLQTLLAIVVLLVAFVFYMKWFNAPLAETASNFIFKTEAQVDNCAVVTGDALNENEVLVKLESLEEHMNTLEDLIEIQNAETTPDQFEVAAPVDVEPTEDELFEEFKTWREENK